MQASFNRDEMISATSAAKNFGKVVTDLVDHKREKTAVLRNNKIAAVILPVDEYERLAELADFVEHLEIFDTITRRKKNPPSHHTTLDDLLKEEGIEL